MTTDRRLVIVVRADPVICGHSGEARNLAEVALTRGFTEVRIVTWPLERLVESGLPLKPMETVMPYSPGITVERPGPVGGYKIPDGRYLAGMVGRLVESLPTACPPWPCRCTFTRTPRRWTTPSAWLAPRESPST